MIKNSIQFIVVNRIQLLCFILIHY